MKNARKNPRYMKFNISEGVDKKTRGGKTNYCSHYLLSIFSIKIDSAYEVCLNSITLLSYYSVL